MKCAVEGCERDALYKGEQLCQKHYFRKWRNGTTNLVRTRKYRLQNPKGYQRIYEPNHPLSDKRGYVYEHRAVLYSKIGDVPFTCDLCGVTLTWSTCHVDHIDNDVTNNKEENLRPTCSTCNTRRGMGEPVTWSRTHVIEFEGERKTPTEWARDSRVSVCGNQIVLRKMAGMSDADALFSAKKTHNGMVPRKKQTPPKHTRKNSISITINGETMTSAEWARRPECTVTDGAIRNRIKSGWDRVESVLTPKRATRRSTPRS